MDKRKKATLRLENGTVMQGFSFGLLTFALFLGFLPAWAGVALPNAGWFLMLGALASLGLLLPGLRKKV